MARSFQSAPSGRSRAAGRAQPATGSSPTIAKFCSTDTALRVRRSVWNFVPENHTGWSRAVWQYQRVIRRDACYPPSAWDPRRQAGATISVSLSAVIARTLQKARDAKRRRRGACVFPARRRLAIVIRLPLWP
jgi:hypothetical protein